MIAITFALPAESSEFLRRVTNKSRTNRNGISIVRGMVGDRAVEILHTGVGEKICKERLRKFLDDPKFDLLISAGFAGALNNESEVGDVLLAKNFSTVDLKQAQVSLSGLSVRTADLLTLPALINSREERERIARESGAAAVDMETEFIVRACAERAIRLLSLRVISDAPSEPLPVSASVLFDMERQRTNLTN